VAVLSSVTPATLEAIWQFDTCTIANAIERFGVRLKNEGYTRPGLQCFTPGFPKALGYAATFVVRSADPPVTGGTCWERTAWWDEIEALSAPRIAVIQNPESLEEGAGAVLGEVHAAILRAFGCQGAVTDGAVRDLSQVAEIPFALFARGVAVSHAYTHVVEFGAPVEIFGLGIRTGDLLFADCHGVLSIPLEIADRIPQAAAQIRAREKRIVDLCRSRDFSRERLWRVLQDRS